MSDLRTGIALQLDVLTKYACGWGRGWLYGEVTIVSEKLKLHWLAAKKANRTVSKDYKVQSQVRQATEYCINVMRRYT